MALVKKHKVLLRKIELDELANLDLDTLEDARIALKKIFPDIKRSLRLREVLLTAQDEKTFQRKVQRLGQRRPARYRPQDTLTTLLVAYSTHPVDQRGRAGKAKTVPEGRSQLFLRVHTADGGIVEIEDHGEHFREKQRELLEDWQWDLDIDREKDAISWQSTLPPFLDSKNIGFDGQPKNDPVIVANKAAVVLWEFNNVVEKVQQDMARADALAEDDAGGAIERVDKVESLEVPKTPGVPGPPFVGGNWKGKEKAKATRKAKKEAKKAETRSKQEIIWLLKQQDRQAKLELALKNLATIGPERRVHLGTKVNTWLRDGKARGVIVTRVSEESPAGEDGVRKGDIITKINDKVVTDRAAYKRMIKDVEPGQPVEFTILRKGKKRIVEIEPQLTEHGRYVKFVP